MTSPETPDTPRHAIESPAGRSVLPAMALGGAVGLIVGQVIDRAAGGADPMFAGGIGGALGAALGRSGWMRVSTARSRGVHPSAALALLIGKLVGSGLLGIGVVSLLSGAAGDAVRLGTLARVAALTVGGAILVAIALLEHRLLRGGRLS